MTHHHFDHISDLYGVILNTCVEGHRHALRIEGPPGTRDIVSALLDHVYDRDREWRSLGGPAHGGWAPVEVTEIGAGEVARGGGWQATSEQVLHGHGLPSMTPSFPGRWHCHGYRSEVAGQVFAFSGDKVDCPGLRERARGADALAMC